MTSPDPAIQVLHHELAALTEQNRVLEAALRRAQERQSTDDLFPLFLASVQEYAILMLDPTGHIISWNAGAERIKGYHADEIIGRHFSVFYPPEDIARDKPRNELEIATATGRFEEEGWRLRKDGTPFWATVLITAMRDESGTLRGFAKVTRDITERRQAEEVQRQSIRQEELIRVQQATLRELSTPLLPIADGVLIVPLVGSISQQRAQDMTETLLTGIAAQRTHTVIIDITGVVVVDTAVANALIRASQAARLLGAKVMLTGIQPDVAQTLVALGVDFQHILTRSTLQRSVIVALR